MAGRLFRNRRRYSVKTNIRYQAAFVSPYLEITIQFNKEEAVCPKQVR